MLLDLFDAFEETDAVLRLLDQELVDQVDALPGEFDLAVRHFERCDFGFVLGDELAYFVSGSAVVRPLRERALPSS